MLLLLTVHGQREGRCLHNCFGILTEACFARMRTGHQAHNDENGGCIQMLYQSIP